MTSSTRLSELTRRNAVLEGGGFLVGGQVTLELGVVAIRRP